MTAGGALIIAQSTIIGNTAVSFGGGLLVGGTSAGQSSCTLSLDGSNISGNVAQQAGSQVHNNCGGDVNVTNTRIQLSASDIEVCVRSCSSVCSLICDLCAFSLLYISLAGCDATGWLGILFWFKTAMPASIAVWGCVWWLVRRGRVRECLRVTVGYREPCRSVQGAVQVSNVHAAVRLHALPLWHLRTGGWIH